MDKEMTKHHPIENLAHAISCNSGGMTKEGHEHLLEAAKEAVANRRKELHEDFHSLVPFEKKGER